jgi:Zn finger protein HypA/HybF involved in hydrogenase expression
MKTLIILSADDKANIASAEFEYYCRNCNQLRLWARPGKPIRCGSCNSTNIEIDVKGSDRLFALRRSGGK